VCCRWITSLLQSPRAVALAELVLPFAQLQNKIHICGSRDVLEAKPEKPIFRDFYVAISMSRFLLRKSEIPVILTKSLDRERDPGDSKWIVPAPRGACEGEK
jgi:hypothetical protein